MQPLQVLARARAQFETRLARVDPADLDKPTPCPGWDVKTLIEHVIRGDHMAAALLRGATRDEGIAALFGPVDGELQGAFAAAADELAAALGEPGALDTTVHHAVGDVPATMLIGFRAGDYMYHAWDLARATGQSDTLDPDVAAWLLPTALANANRMTASGLFGDGPTGLVGEDASAQDRLLDVVGRRP